MSQKVFITGASRTPLGSFKGSFLNIPATGLGAVTVKESLHRSKAEPTDIDELYMGMVLPGGAGQAPARQVALSAGLANSVSATTINKVCGSGMKTVMFGASQIALERADLVIAGGMENMSRVPFAIQGRDIKETIDPNDLIDLMVHDGLWDVYNDFHMGIAAERCAEKYKITRRMQDEYAVKSYERSLDSTGKYFKEEIVPVSGDLGRDGKGTIYEDEEPKRVKFEKIPNIRPAFKENGTITAANASTISDGAASVVLSSEKKIRELDLPVLARIVDWSSHAQDPLWFSTAPVGAINKLLKRNNLKSRDIGLFEVNEAFSVVVLAVMKLADLPPERVNVRGGAVSLGHPIGCSGTRIIVTLLYNMIQSQVRHGIAAICIGGGEATAILLEI